VKLKIIMRYRPGITPDDRVSHGGQGYGIEAVLDVHSSRRELHLMCGAIG
jgi:head-tail adaptor